MSRGNQSTETHDWVTRYAKNTRLAIHRDEYDHSIHQYSTYQLQ